MKMWVAILSLSGAVFSAHASSIPEECRTSLEEQRAYFATMSAKVKADFDRGVINEGEKSVTEQLIASGKESVATGCVQAVYSAVNGSAILRSYYRLNTQSLERRALEARDQALHFLNGT